MPRGKSNIAEALNNLDKTDIYSLILFMIYKIKDIPECSTLSELCYILDNENLINLLDYYGGSTIRIPTKEEFQQVVDILLLYEEINIENIPFEDATKEIGIKNNKDTKDLYTKISNLLKDYNFRRK